MADTNPDTYRDGFLATLSELVGIPSCSSADGGDEAAIQSCIEQRMRRLTPAVRTFEAADVPEFFTHQLCCGPDRNYAGRPTVIAELGPQTAPALLLLAHADTVSINNEPERWTYGPFNPVVADGKLYGRGSSDDKWGTAAILTLLQIFTETDELSDKRLIFASTIDEENGVGNGLLLLHLAGVEAECALYLDGCNDVVTIGRLGGSNLYLRPRDGVDNGMFDTHCNHVRAACEQLCRDRAGAFDQPWWRDNLVRDTSVVLRRAADAAGPFMLIAFHTLPDDDAAEYCRWLEAAVGAALGDDISLYDLSYRQPWFEPWLVDPALPLIGHLSDGIEAEMHRQPVAVTGMKQDSFVLNEHAGIPTISFGPGRIGVAGAVHEPDEFIDLQHAWDGFRAAHRAVQSWLAS